MAQQVAADICNKLLSRFSSIPGQFHQIINLYKH